MNRPTADWISAAEQELKRTGIPASFQLAQAIVESGWGKHVIAGNMFGMKCPVGHDGVPLYPYVMERTAEDHPDGSVYYIEAPFRSFTTVDEAFAAHADLLCKPVYAKAKALLPDLDAYIDAVSPIYASGVAYAKTIKAVIAGSDLTQYDSMIHDTQGGLMPAEPIVSEPISIPTTTWPGVTVPVSPTPGIAVSVPPLPANAPPMVPLPAPAPPGQIVVSTDAVQDHLVTLLTGALRVAGAFLVAKGYFDASTVNAMLPEIVGTIMTVGGQIWANWRTQSKRTAAATGNTL